MNEWLPFATAALGFVTVIIGWKVINMLKQISINIDGRLSQLLALTKVSSHAEGVKDEKQEQSDARNN